MWLLFPEKQLVESVISHVSSGFVCACFPGRFHLDECTLTRTHSPPFLFDFVSSNLISSPSFLVYLSTLTPWYSGLTSGRSFSSCGSPIPSAGLSGTGCRHCLLSHFTISPHSQSQQHHIHRHKHQAAWAPHCRRSSESSSG